MNSNILLYSFLMLRLNNGMMNNVLMHTSYKCNLIGRLKNVSVKTIDVEGRDLQIGSSLLETLN